VAHTPRRHASVLIGFLAVIALLGSAAAHGTPIAAQPTHLDVKGLAAGNQHTCALLHIGSVMCWGYNGTGELGIGTLDNFRTRPVNVSGLESSVQAITAGASHTCALLTSGSVQCWGGNHVGQLGDGTNTTRPRPVNVSGLSSGVQAIAAGWYHTCALLSGGGVTCWGWNGEGELGDGTTTGRSTPVSVSGLSSSVRALTAGRVHTCALLNEGTVMCWGDNSRDQLSDGTSTTRTTPVNVVGLSGSVEGLTAGADHTCAILSGGGVTCWGWNQSGQLGDGTLARRTSPVSVTNVNAPVQAVAAGVFHTCALPITGGVLCWGRNSEGQLGDGTYTNRAMPGAVSGLASSAQAIAAGHDHTCALLNGGVMCWGRNGSGQLGDGTAENNGPTPVFVSGFPPGPAMPDANRDGVTNAVDALCILRQLGEFTSTTHCRLPLSFGDVNQSGVTNAVDALCVLRYLGRFPWTNNCPYDPPA